MKNIKYKQLPIFEEENSNQKSINNASDTSPDCLSKLNLSFEEIEISPLKLNRNHSYVSLLNERSSEFYFDEFLHFDCYTPPFVAKTNTEFLLLSNLEDVEAAINAATEKIKVTWIKGLFEDDFLRFINYRSHYGKKSYKNLFDVFGLLQTYFTHNPKGQQWAEELPGDMKRKLSKVLNVSESTVKILYKLESIIMRI